MKIITIILIALAVYILFKILSAPIKLIFKILINAAVGLIILFIFNVIGSQFGFILDINLVTCLISGVLGIPGVIILIILKLLL